MNRKSLLCFVMIVVLAISCDHVYREYDKKSFPAYIWKPGQEVNFNPTIEDTKKSYKLTLGIRHIYGFQLNNVSVSVTATTPAGKQTTKDYEIRIKDAKGNYVGSCGGDICDLETVVEQSVEFEEPGQYKYSVRHNVQSGSIPGIMEVGLIIDAVD